MKENSRVLPQLERSIILPTSQVELRANQAKVRGNQVKFLGLRVESPSDSQVLGWLNVDFKVGN